MGYYNEPRIGIFWIINDCVSQVAVQASKLKADTNGFKIYSKRHCECWYGASIDTGAEHDYDSYPRGRVVYNIDDDVFLVWLDKCINDLKHQNKICNDFCLNGKDVVFEIDEQYKCLGCVEGERV